MPVVLEEEKLDKTDEKLIKPSVHDDNLFPDDPYIEKDHQET